MEFHPFAAYLKEFSQRETPYIEIALLPTGDMLDSGGWGDAWLCRGPVAGPTIGTGRAWLRVEPATHRRPSLDADRSQEAIVCEVDVRAGEPTQRLEIRTPPGCSLLGRVLGARLSPLIGRECAGGAIDPSAAERKRAFRPVRVQVRAVDSELAPASKRPLALAACPSQYGAELCGWTPGGSYLWRCDLFDY